MNLVSTRNAMNPTAKPPPSAAPKQSRNYHAPGSFSDTCPHCLRLRRRRRRAMAFAVATMGMVLIVMGLLFSAVRAPVSGPPTASLPPPHHTPGVTSLSVR